MSVVFAGLILAIETSWRKRVTAIVWVVSIPLAYQVFRMAYYAALVPNTALAKEASSSDWWRGWAYFLDFFGAYRLWIPVALLVVAGLVPLFRSPLVRRSRSLVFLITAPLVASLLHATYVIRVGGDFMHARMLLPSLGCFLLPAAVIVVRGWRWLGVSAVAVWVLVCALFLRSDYLFRNFTHPGHIGLPSRDALVGDERAVDVGASGQENPVTLDDYGVRHSGFQSVWVSDGREVRRRAAAGERGFLVDGLDPGAALLPLRAGVVTTSIVAVFPNIGLYGYAAGPDVFVVDKYGIADPYAARLTIQRGTAGHEKNIDPAWEFARFVAPPLGEQSFAVQNARRALRCADLPKLFRDVTSSLGVHQAWRNFWDSFSLTSLRIPRSTKTAARELCNK